MLVASASRCSLTNVTVDQDLLDRLQRSSRTFC